MFISFRDMVKQLYPAGDGPEIFVYHIMRVFDTDGNDFLDFKEFLMAMDISNCQTSENIIHNKSLSNLKLILLAEAKLNWAFKLYDVDNDGFIDLKEMTVIIEMMDDLDGIKPGFIKRVLKYVFKNRKSLTGEIRYDANGNPEPLPTATERAESLFSALDKDNDGCLTKTEFISGYTKRYKTTKTYLIYLINNKIFICIMLQISYTEKTGC